MTRVRPCTPPCAELRKRYFRVTGYARMTLLRPSDASFMPISLTSVEQSNQSSHSCRTSAGKIAISEYKTPSNAELRRTWDTAYDVLAPLSKQPLAAIWRDRQRASVSFTDAG